MILLAFLIGLGLVFGCGKPGGQARKPKKVEKKTSMNASPEKDHGGIPSEPEEDTSAEPLATNPKLTREECLGFAKRFSDAVKRDDTDLFRTLWDMDAMLETATSGIDAPESLRISFCRTFKKQADLLTRITQSLFGGGTYRFLHIHDVCAERRALFRLVKADGGLNYHDLVLSRNQSGEVVAVDMDVFLSGEKMSATTRRGYLLIVGSNAPGCAAKLGSKEKAFEENLGLYTRILACIKSGEFQEALTHIASLPPILRQDKSMMVFALTSAAGVGPVAYEEAFQAFEKAYPGDPSLVLHAIDHHYLKKEYEQAFQSILSLEKSLGGDPYLHVVRSDILVIQGKTEDGRKRLLQAIEEDPDLQEAYWSLANLALGQKDYAETSKWVKAMLDKVMIEFDDLIHMEEFEDYVKSEEFARLKERRGGD